MPDLNTLERGLGVSFKDKKLLEQALIHSSFSNENPDASWSNERLEYLGDAVVALAVAQELYQRNPDLSEGGLTSLRSSLVSGKALAKVGQALKLGQTLSLGQGEESNGGRQRESNLAAAFEAVVGAVFLDRGYEVAYDLVIRCMSSNIDVTLAEGIPQDAKSRLQERAQSDGYQPPTYRTVRVSGPDHQREFTVDVTVGGAIKGRGTGSRKAEAEQRAAEEALASMR